MVCNDHANMTSKLLASSFTFECRIMHYIPCRVLLPRSINLAQASEEDLIFLWALQTGCQIDWAHLVRYHMHKALRTNAPLLYPHLVTLFLQHFNVPLEDESFVKVKRSFSIGVGVVSSFGYRKDMDDQWVHKQDFPPPILDERTPSPPPQRDSSSSLLNDVLTELRDLWAFIGDRFDAMDSHITHLEDNIRFICRCFDPPANP